MKNRNALTFIAGLVLCFFSSLSFSQSCSLHDSRAAALAACQASSFAIIPGVNACRDYPNDKVIVHSSYELENNPNLQLDFGRNTCGGNKRNCKHYSFSYTTCEEGTVWLQESCSCGTPPECPPGEVKDPITGNCGPVDCSGRKGENQTSRVGISDNPPRFGCGGGCEFKCASCGVISETHMGCSCKYTGNNCPIEEPKPPEEGGGNEGGGNEGGGNEGGGNEGGGNEGGGGGGLPNGCMKDESGTIWCVGGDGEGEGEGDGKGQGMHSTTCKEPPKSTGDPQLAAIHLQIWAQMCHGEEIKESDIRNALDSDGELTDLSDLKDDDYKKDKTDEIQNAVNSALSGLNSASGSGGGCSIQDINGSIMGKRVNIQVSKVCDLIQVARAAILLLAYVFAAVILLRAVVGEGYN